MNNLKKINKRGFLLAEETLKIILALIAISFLIYFLVSLYMTRVGSENLKHAEATLERIRVVATNLQNDAELINDPTPAGWTLFPYVGAKKPNFCGNKNCLCLCDRVFALGVSNSRQLKECDDKGACIIFENLDDFLSIKIEKAPFALKIIKEEKIKIIKNGFG